MQAQRARMTSAVKTHRSPVVDYLPRTLPGGDGRRASERWCETCCRPILDGAVNRGNSEYCSVECALSAVVPGRYLG